jgi:hypothetical protein
MSVRRSLKRGITVLAAAPLLALAQSSPPEAIVPRPNGATGYSSIEQRWVYAPPDEGTLEFDLIPGAGAPNEVIIQEPVMCQPDSSAHATVKYSKSKDLVDVTIDYHGLPYRMSYTRPVDISTQFNQYPVSVQDGRWQVWFVQESPVNTANFYYDPNTLQLLGSEFDTPNPPADAIVIPVPTMRMIQSPIFEGNKKGLAHFHETFSYSKMIDWEGTAGVAVAFLPFNLCFPDQYSTYYTNGGLPTDKALSFDDVLGNIHGGYGLAVATSLEPAVKPDYLKARDNPMIGWAGGYPQAIPGHGVFADPIQGTVEYDACGPTHINRGWSSAYYNVCFGH